MDQNFLTKKSRKDTNRKKKIRKRIKKRIRLPRKLLFIPSSDKDFIENWKGKGKNPDPLNIPSSFRMCILGGVGKGKTCFIKNQIIRTKPPFERIFVFHQDKYAREYDDIDAEVLEELPPNDFWMGYAQEGGEEGTDPHADVLSDQDLDDTERPKTLCILDDVCFGNLPKEQTMRLDRLCGFISSHCNVSICCINQDFFALNSIVKKCANVFVIYKPNCTDELNTIARRCGMTSKEMKYLFENIAKEDNDSIMIDKTPGSPYPLRLNGFTPINKTEKNNIN